MSYINSNLLPEEKVTLIAKIHWSIFIFPAITILFSFYLGMNNGVFAKTIFIIGIIWLIRKAIYFFTTEIAITSKRTIAKFGLFRINSIEISHSAVESINVDQNALGRTLNYGTILIKGTGSGCTPAYNIDDPMTFRKKALETIESSKS